MVTSWRARPPAYPVPDGKHSPTATCYERKPIGGSRNSKLSTTREPHPASRLTHPEIAVRSFLRARHLLLGRHTRPCPHSGGSKLKDNMGDLSELPTGYTVHDHSKLGVDS
jgi:hypothetical protein